MRALGARRLAAVAAVAAVAASTAASAQSSSVWLDPPESSRREPAAQWMGRILQQAARCVVSRNRGAAENLAATVPDTAAEWRVIYGPIRSRLQQCVGRIDVSRVLLRGAIAETLYESAFTSVPSVSREVEPIRWRSDSAGATSLAPIYELGRCAAAGRAEPIHGLLATEPFSDRERDKLRELMPMLQPCLDRGLTFATDRETLRAILAESLYRWARAQTAGR